MSALEDFHDPFAFGEEERTYPPDPKTQQAKKLILERLTTDSKRVNFQRQLEVIFEKQFFHWVTDRAIKELEEEDRIIVEYFPMNVGTHRDVVKMITLKSNRFYKREAKKVLNLIAEYSDPSVTQDVGYWGQELFKLAYVRCGFRLVGEDVNEFHGRAWEESGKNIDFVVEKKGKYFGCEVKNMLGYMDKKEWEEKLKMCRHFGIIPVFIVRYSPTVWNYEIFRQGGLVQIFETQVFSPGRGELVSRLREDLELPVIVSRRIPDSIMERFERLLEARVFKEGKM